MLVSEVEAGVPPDATHEYQRHYVYAKHGTFDICNIGCEEDDWAIVCLTGGQASPGYEDDLTAEDDVIYYAYDADGTTAEFDALAGDDYVNTGPGNDTAVGGPGDDTLEDHSGSDNLDGQAGSDTLISRSGYDALSGGEADDDADLDTNTFIIYPTHEKYHHFGHTTAELDTCTQILDMQISDTIIFKLDDPTYPDYKFTNDDDTCGV